MDAERRFPTMPVSVTATRHFVRRVLRDAGTDEDTIDRAELLASELATSAVLHGHSGFAVRLSVDGTVRIEVSDTLPSFPAAPDRSGDPKLSLYVLDGMADRWGWDTAEHGKTVWCEVRSQVVGP